MYVYHIVAAGHALDTVATDVRVGNIGGQENGLAWLQRHHVQEIDAKAANIICK